MKNSKTRLLIMISVCVLLFLFNCFAVYGDTTGAGSALNFNGNDNFVIVPDSPSLSFVTTLTVEAWINPITISNLHGIIVNKDDFYGTSREFDLDVTANLQFEIFSSPSAYDYARDGDPSLSTWSHVAGVYDGTSIHLYLNGTEVASAPFTGSIPMTNVPISIGNSYTQDRPFDGTIDEVRVWNIARSQAQIQSTMNCPLTGNETGLAGYWRFDEGSGLIAYDASGHGNNGQLGGSTTVTNADDPTWVVSDAPLNCNSTTTTQPPPPPPTGAGNALNFYGPADSGPGGVVEVPSSPSLSFSSTITVECWINPNRIYDSSVFVSKDDGNTNREFILQQELYSSDLQFQILSSPSITNYVRGGLINYWSLATCGRSV